MAQHIDIRPAFSLHSPRIQTNSISFLHPGYPDSENLLLSLNACDNGGLHYGTAHTACAIVSGNRFDGYFTRDRLGQPVTAGEDDLLRGPSYYFCLPEPSSLQYAAHPSAPYRYPVVPSFFHWRFPHERLPLAWNNLPVESDVSLRSQSDAIYIRDGSCRITDYCEECDGAHLCPAREQAWFVREQMVRYNHNQRATGATAAINDQANMLLLRADVHRSFDEAAFVIVPKAGKIIAHVLASGNELVSLYHNRELLCCKVGKENLFARFAWAVFRSIGIFMWGGVARTLLLVEGVQEVDGEDCGDLTLFNGPPKSSRTPSPKKRPYGETLEDSCQPRDTEADCKARKWKRGPEESILGRQATYTGTIKRLQTSPSPAMPPSPVDFPNQPSFTHSFNPPLTPPPIAPFDASTKESSLEEKEEERIWKLKEKYLDMEKARSDPEGTWDKEQEWLNSVAGGPITDVKRLFRAWGYDIQDDFDEEPDPKGTSNQTPALVEYD